MNEFESLVQALEATLVTIRAHSDLLTKVVDYIKDLEGRVKKLEENE